MNPIVSVIIPNYNYAKYVGEAIDSVLEQTYPNIEIIVVDDGSTDDSAEVLSAYGDKIKVIFQENAGVSAARNNGVMNSTGEYLAFLDADDVWMSHKLREQMSLTKQGETELVHCGYMEIDTAGNKIGLDMDGASGNEVYKNMLFFEPGIIGGCSTAVMTRELFNKIGGFDKRLSTAADWDIYFNAARRTTVGFIPEPLMKYRLHGTNMHGNIPVMERDMLLAFEKAFDSGELDLAQIRNKAYGILYRVLAGSYFQAGQYGGFFRNALKSIAKRPANIGYFLAFPLRKLGLR